MKLVVDLCRIAPSMRRLLADNVDLIAAAREELPGEAGVMVVDVPGRALWTVRRDVPLTKYQPYGLQEFVHLLAMARPGGTLEGPYSVYFWDGKELLPSCELTEEVVELILSLHSPANQHSGLTGDLGQIT